MNEDKPAAAQAQASTGRCLASRPPSLPARLPAHRFYRPVMSVSMCHDQTFLPLSSLPPPSTRCTNQVGDRLRVIQSGSGQFFFYSGSDLRGEKGAGVCFLFCRKLGSQGLNLSLTCFEKTLRLNQFFFKSLYSSLRGFCYRAEVNWSTTPHTHISLSLTYSPTYSHNVQDTDNQHKHTFFDECFFLQLCGLIDWVSTVRLEIGR